MFEQKYTRANDRIHPRKDLLQELEAKWAAEQARVAEEEQKVVHIRTWPRYVGMAAGIVRFAGAPTVQTLFSEQIPVTRRNRSGRSYCNTE